MVEVAAYCLEKVQMKTVLLRVLDRRQERRLCSWQFARKERLLGKPSSTRVELTIYTYYQVSLCLLD